MEREMQNTRRWKKRATVMLATAAALTALVFTSPVEAGNKHRRHYKPQKHHKQYKPYKQHRHNDYGHVQKHRGHQAMPSAYVTQIEMHRRYGVDYRPFRVGRTWFRPHRHRHDIYVIPIRTRHGVVYREVEYCHGDPFVRPHSRNHIALHGKHASISIGF